MGKIRFNEVGFMICLLCTKTKEKVYFYADVATWKDAYNRGLEMMHIKAYMDFGIFSITRTLQHVDDGKNL